jgi:copper chaperone
MQSKIYIQNLKCGGCAKTITNNLKTINSVENVEIDIENSAVSLTHHQDVLDEIKETLKSIGYPEQGENNNILDKTKSYISCAIGKF